MRIYVRIYFNLIDDVKEVALRLLHFMSYIIDFYSIEKAPV